MYVLDLCNGDCSTCRGYDELMEQVYTGYQNFEIEIEDIICSCDCHNLTQNKESL